MARKIKHPKNGSIIAFEVSAEELSKELGVAEEIIEAAPRLFYRQPDGAYRIESKQQLDEWTKRARILATGTTPSRVEEIEKEGSLDRYAKLAEKCPRGVDTDMLRSYLSIVIQQEHKGVKMGPEHLARSLNMFTRNSDGDLIPNIELAAKHIRLLTATPAPNSPGEMMLEEGQGEWQGQWRHQGFADYLTKD